MMNKKEQEAFDAMYRACLNAEGDLNIIESATNLPGLPICKNNLDKAIKLAEEVRNESQSTS